MTDSVVLPVDTRSPIFIGGQRRSGTTLLRVLLNRHPHIACGPETHFVRRPDIQGWHARLSDEWGERVERYGFERSILDRSMASLIDNLFTRYQLREGKLRWAEKTPNNILHIDYLFRLFPCAQFIHIIRDPRDVYGSIVQRLRTDKPHWDKFTPQYSAEDWCKAILAGKTWRGETDRYLEIHYESLVSTPENLMQTVMNFLREPWDPCILDPRADNHEVLTQAGSKVRAPVSESSVGRWKTDVGSDDVAIIESIAGNYMLELGYQLS
ncbi:MAG: sulfotransferase [Chloroflexota bacterium]